jgi:acetoin utilization deacetylase AcuC-like enzyme
MSSDCTARFVFRSEYELYDFGPQHPLRPERIRSSLDLLQMLGLGPEADQMLHTPEATSADLQLVHAPEYVNAVQRFDLFADDAGLAAEAERWGLGAGDSPAFVGMHAASALIAGGSLHALRSIQAGEFQHAFHPAGGLHHARRDRASGFCVHNDAAVAIAGSLREREARVLYLDFDAHHGDGVQAAFYEHVSRQFFDEVVMQCGQHLARAGAARLRMRYGDRSAEGGCAVSFRGEQLVLRSPQIVPASVAAPLVPRSNAMLWRRFNVAQYLLLQVSEQSGVANQTAVAEAV